MIRLSSGPRVAAIGDGGVALVVVAGFTLDLSMDFLGKLRGDLGGFDGGSASGARLVDRVGVFLDGAFGLLTRHFAGQVDAQVLDQDADAGGHGQR